MEMIVESCEWVEFCGGLFGYKSWVLCPCLCRLQALVWRSFIKLRVYRKCLNEAESNRQLMHFSLLHSTEVK